MATLYITECLSLGYGSANGVAIQAPMVPAVAEQNISITGNSTNSAAFNTATRFVMLNTDAACSLAFSTTGNATASASYHRLGANETRFYGVSPGGKVAVITNS